MKFEIVTLAPEPPEDGKRLWRAFIRSESNYVAYATFPILRHTPKGAWIQVDGREKWVPNDGRFASETKKHALDRLKARTRAYRRHSKRALREAERRCAILDIPARPKNTLNELLRSNKPWL